MCCKVGNATDGVTLNLDVRGVHLFDEGYEASEGDDGDLVLGCYMSVIEDGG